MTLKDLIREVSALGFDGRVEADELLMSSLNRSQKQIFGERSITSNLTFFANGQKPQYRLPYALHSMGESLSFSLSGMAYSFFVSGEGSFTVKDKSGTRSESFRSTNAHFSGFLCGTGEIIFTGDYAYSISDLVCWGQVFSADPKDIPDGTGRTVYSMRKLAADFLTFAAPPTDRNGKEIPNLRVEDDRIILDEDYTGYVSVTYRRAPRLTVAADTDKDIDIPKEYEHLLAPLTAYFVYLDSDEEKAREYLELYKDLTKRENKFSKDRITAQYRITDGWA